MGQLKSDLAKLNEGLVEEISRLQGEVARLSVKPYDQQKLIRTRGLVGDLRYIKRDLLRLILMTGDTRGDVIFNARVRVYPSFTIDAFIRPLQDKGLITREDNHLTGYATFAVNPSSIDVKDVLYPRDEGINEPFFKGI
jgi:hypothetical protein